MEELSLRFCHGHCILNERERNRRFESDKSPLDIEEIIDCEILKNISQKMLTNDLADDKINKPCERIDFPHKA